MKAQFVSKFPNVRLIRNFLDKHKVKEREYIIERSILLGREDFIYLREHLLEYNKNIAHYKSDMYVDKNGVLHVIMFCSITCDIMLLVNSKGFNYAQYVALINNGGEQVERRYTISNRYPKKSHLS